MKKKIIIYFVGVVFILSSCKKLTEMNVDPKNPSTATSETLFTYSQKALMDQVITPSQNQNVLRLFAQYWAATTYIDETNYNLTTRNIPDFEFSRMYQILANLNELKNTVDNENLSDEVKKNRKAIAEILMVYGFQRLVDIFGNIPYKEAFDANNIHPKYDDAQSIYADLFNRLNAAIASLDASAGSYAGADAVYNGDVDKWKKFANSLKLRMAITVADVTALDPGKKAKEAVDAGVFTDASYNATFPYQGNPTNANPIWLNLVASDRYDWVPTAGIVDTLIRLNDPRLPLYITDPVGGVYIGGVYGATNTYANYSHITKTIQSQTWPGLLLDYTEIQFYLAEAVERGFISGNAETYYNEGIKSSLNFWAAASGIALDNAVITAYITQPSVAYSNNASGGSYKEKIAKQAWIAYFDRGDIAWATYRRLDFPHLAPLPGETVATVPKRYTYPVSESKLNNASYTAASAAMGGDNLTSKIFWDKN